MRKRANTLDEEIRRLERAVADGGGMEAVVRLVRAYERAGVDVGALALTGQSAWVLRQEDPPLNADTDDTYFTMELGVYQTAEDAWNAALALVYEWAGEALQGDNSRLYSLPADEAIQWYNDSNQTRISVNRVLIARTPIPAPTPPRPRPPRRRRGERPRVAEARRRATEAIRRGICNICGGMASETRFSRSSTSAVAWTHDADDSGSARAAVELDRDHAPIVDV